MEERKLALCILNFHSSLEFNVSVFQIVVSRNYCPLVVLTGSKVLKSCYPNIHLQAKKITGQRGFIQIGLQL